MTDAQGCPLCGSLVQRIADRAWCKDGFDIVRCPACGLVYRFVVPTRDELDAIYAEGYFDSTKGDTGGQGYADYIGDEPLHRLSARRRLSELERLVPAAGRLLDVGAAAGFFVEVAGKAGWDARGIDIADSMTGYARERLGVDVATTTLAEAEVEPASLEAVTMWDYLEHADDPIGDLERTASLLRPGGVLGLSTGDIGAAVARICGSRWHLLTPRHHNFFFDRATLTRALTSAGLDVVSIRYPGSRYPLSYVVYKLQTMARLSLLDRVAARMRGSAVGRFAVPLNLGDIMTVWAQRT